MISKRYQAGEGEGTFREKGIHCSEAWKDAHRALTAGGSFTKGNRTKRDVGRLAFERTKFPERDSGFKKIFRRPHRIKKIMRREEKVYREGFSNASKMSGTWKK